MSSGIRIIGSANISSPLVSQRSYFSIKSLKPLPSNGRFAFLSTQVGYLFSDSESNFRATTLSSNYVRASARAQLHDLVLMFLHHIGLLSQIFIEYAAPGLGQNQPDGKLVNDYQSPGQWFDLTITKKPKAELLKKFDETQGKCSVLAFGSECLFNFYIPEDLKTDISQLQEFLKPLLDQYPELDSYEFLTQQAPIKVTHPGPDHPCYLRDVDCVCEEEGNDYWSEDQLRQDVYNANFPPLGASQRNYWKEEVDSLKSYLQENTEKEYDARIWTGLPLVHPDGKYRISCDYISRCSVEIDLAMKKAKDWKSIPIKEGEKYHDFIQVPTGILEKDINTLPGYHRTARTPSVAYNGRIQDDLDAVIDAICLSNSIDGNLDFSNYYNDLRDSIVKCSVAAGWSREEAMEHLNHLNDKRSTVLNQSLFLFSLAMKEAILCQRHGIGKEYIKHVFGDLYIFVKTIEPEKPIFMSLIFPQTWKTILPPGCYRPCTRLSNGYLMTKGHTYSIPDARFLSGNDLRLLGLYKGSFSISSNPIFRERLLAFGTIISNNCKQGEADALQQMRYWIPKVIAPRPRKIKKTIDKMSPPYWTVIQALIPQRCALWCLGKRDSKASLREGKLVNYTCPILGIPLDTLHEAMSVAYLYFYHDPAHADPVMSQWKVLKKTMKMNAEVEKIALESWRGVKSHEELFSRPSVWKGMREAWSAFNSKVWMKDVMQDFQSRISSKMLSEYATNKSSNQSPDEYAARSKTYIECIKYLDKLSLYPLSDLRRVQEMSSQVMDCDIFRKDQPGGDRLITIMTIISRISLDWLEELSRSIAKRIPSEKIIHWADKAEMMKRFMKVHSNDFSMCANIDMSSWAEGLTTHQFFLIFKSLFYHTEFEVLLPLIASIINVEGSETLKVFEELALSVKSGRFTEDSPEWRYLQSHLFETAQGAFKVHCPRGMGQGTLQVSSSVLHALLDKALEIALKRKFPEIIGYESGVSSDDQVILIAFNRELSDEEQIAIEDFIEKFCQEWGLVFNSAKSNFFWGRLRNQYCEFNSCIMQKDSQFHPLVSFLSNIGNLSGQANLQDRSLESAGLLTGMVAEGLFGNAIYDVELLLSEYVCRSLGMGLTENFHNFLKVWEVAPLPCFGAPTISRKGLPGFRQYYLLIDNLLKDPNYKNIVEKCKSLGMLSENSDLGITIIPKLLIGKEEESKSKELYNKCVAEGILFDSKTLRELENSEPLLFLSRQKGFLAMKARFSYEAERKARLNLAVRDSESRVLGSSVYVSSKDCLLLSVSCGRETIHTKTNLLDCLNKILETPNGYLPWEPFDVKVADQYVDHDVEDKYFRQFWNYKVDKRGLVSLSDKSTILWKLFGLNPYMVALDHVEESWLRCLAKYSWLHNDINVVLSNLDTNIFNLYQAILTMTDDDQSWHITKPVEYKFTESISYCSGALSENPKIPLEDRRWLKFVSDCIMLDIHLTEDDVEDMLGQGPIEGFVPIIRDKVIDFAYALPDGFEVVMPFSQVINKHDIKHNYVLYSSTFLAVCYNDHIYVSRESDMSSWQTSKAKLKAREPGEEDWTELTIDIKSDFQNKEVTYHDRSDIDNLPIGFSITAGRFPVEPHIFEDGYRLSVKYNPIGCHYLHYITPKLQYSDWTINPAGNPNYLDDILRFNLDVPLTSLSNRYEEDDHIYWAYLKTLYKNCKRFCKLRISEKVFQHISALGDSIDRIRTLNEQTAIKRIDECIRARPPRGSRHAH